MRGVKIMKKLGVYTIRDRISGGGNADVYLAENAVGEQFAIKILREENGNSKRVIKRNRKRQMRFKFETKSVIENQEEILGIIPILDYGLPDKNEKKFWYVMPIAIPLEDKLKELESLEDKIACVLELAQTLSKLHEKHIVHRDIKPKNIYFYDGRYCLGDFGLVDYPEKKDLTSVQEAVGPKATMAPEMRYNPKSADGKKADIYSLAKTLWIVLTGIQHGFEGRYEEDDTMIGLHYDARYKTEHLVELEQLLKQATEYNPTLRPNINAFARTLEKYLEIKQDFVKRNYSEWKYLQNKLFPQTAPMRAEWRDLDSIIRILNNIGAMPGLNHMFLPTAGGGDMESAEYASEEGCICLVADKSNYILKPKKLELENYGTNDYLWSYFRLEVQPLEPILNNENSDYRELLIEDYPGHYIMSNLANYNRYDDGTEFPKGYRVVDRVLKGTFVIFSKQSIYNHIAGTYDARHDKMEGLQFREYIKTMRKSYYELKDFREFSNLYQKSPFMTEDELEKVEFNKRIEESCKFDEFVEESWDKWNLKEICDRNNYKCEGNLEFVILFNINGSSFGARKYISESGSILEEEDIIYPLTKKGKYIFSDFDGAVKAINEIEAYIKKLCDEAEIVWQDMGIYFTINLFRTKPPIHLFSEKEVKEVLRGGNDFINNRLVIDGEGFVQLIDSDLPYESYRYPVIQETYNAGNNYVGKYANLDDVNEIYLALLEGWKCHLKSKRRYVIDYYNNKDNEEKILEEIKNFYC